MTPSVSVFLPVWNGERYLGEAIASVLAQTHADLELVVADDGSTDGSLAIAHEAAHRDPRVRVLGLPHGGEVAARNAALGVVRGELLMNHDADDLSLPGKVAALVQHLADHPRIDVVGCLGEYFDDAGRVLGHPSVETSPGRIRTTFGRMNSVVHSAALVRRRVFTALGGYREACRSADDYDLFARALQAGFRIENLPVVLHRIRLHDDRVSSRQTMRQADAVFRIQQDYRRSGAATGWRTALATPASGRG